MAGVYGEIDSREDFQMALDKAIHQGLALAATQPTNATFEAILRQLIAIRTWTADGRVPTESERQSIDIAVRASREFEGESATYTWTRLLYAIDAYVEDWPSDEAAAEATDDDFFDADE